MVGGALVWGGVVTWAVVCGVVVCGVVACGAWVCGLPGPSVWDCVVLGFTGQYNVGLWCVVLVSVGLLHIGVCCVGALQHCGRLGCVVGAEKKCEMVQ